MALADTEPLPSPVSGIFFLSRGRPDKIRDAFLSNYSNH